MHTVSESIFNGSSVIVALADVQHIEKHDKNSIPGIVIVTSHTKYNFEHDGWENAIWISEPEATAFRSAWCRYRSELEADTLMDLCPSKNEFMRMHYRTMEALGGVSLNDRGGK
jgi:hypothetical protein